MEVESAERVELVILYSGIDMQYRFRYTEFGSSSDPGAGRVSIDP
jgi:hypothetical protein